jgi:hypothetical protein
MKIWLSVYDDAERIENEEFIQELYNYLRGIEQFKKVPIFVITKRDMDVYFDKHRLHDLNSLTNDVDAMLKNMPYRLKYHGSGTRRFMAFRSFPNENIHSITFRIV